MAELLDGIRVLELARHASGPYAGKLLADYGADVIKVESFKGDPARHEGPFKDDIPNPEASALFLHLNLGKRSVTLDVESAAGRDAIRKLIDASDVVIEDFAPGQMEAWGLGYDALAKDHSGLIMASITPFGQDGPWRDFKGTELTLQALGGPMHINGSVQRYPIKSGGYVAHYHAGVAVAYGCVLARFRVMRGGSGDHIDQAIYEAQAGFRDRRVVYTTAAEYTGMLPRRSTPGTRPAFGVRPVADGYVNIYAGGTPRFREALHLIDRDDLQEHPDAGKTVNDYSPDFAEQVEGSWMGWIIQQSMRDAVAQTQAIGLLGGAIFSTQDLVTDPHYRERGVWDTIDHPATGPVEYPGRQMLLSETPRQKPERAPLLGEHNHEVLGGIGYDAEQIAALTGRAS